MTVSSNPTSDDPDAIRADIERTRARLSSDVDALADTANPKHIADRQVDKVKGAVRSVKDRLMGSDDDPYDDGTVGQARDAVAGRAGAARDALSDRASQAGDAISSAPRRAKQQTRGNPLGAGLIAFGVGLLISGLIPSTQQEQRLVSDLQEKAEPLKEKATEAAKEMAENLKEPAQQAVESVKSTATTAVANVKDEGVAAKDDVQSQVQDSKDTIQEKQGS